MRDLKDTLLKLFIGLTIGVILGYCIVKRDVKIQIIEAPIVKYLCR